MACSSAMNRKIVTADPTFLTCFENKTENLINSDYPPEIFMML